jgi:hypothetical protein
MLPAFAREIRDPPMRPLDRIEHEDPVVVRRTRLGAHCRALIALLRPPDQPPPHGPVGELPVLLSERLRAEFAPTRQLVER